MSSFCSLCAWDPLAKPILNMLITNNGFRSNLLMLFILIVLFILFILTPFCCIALYLVCLLCRLIVYCRYARHGVANPKALFCLSSNLNSPSASRPLSSRVPIYCQMARPSAPDVRTLNCIRLPFKTTITG